MKLLVGVVATIAGIALAGASAQAQHPKPAQATAGTPQAAKAPAIEPKAMDILQAACKTLTDAKAMSFTATNTYERKARNGQPLFFTTRNEVTMQRPDKLRVITPGDGVPDEFYYDGKRIMAYVPSENLVATADAPPTIDQMLEVAWQKAAIDFPFSDVIVADPCAVFTADKLQSAFYVGQSKVVGGTTTDMVAVAGKDVQGELWIGADDHLPRMIRVVYPDEPAHALYETTYSDWKLTDSVDAATFTSDKAAAGRKMAFAPPGAGQVPTGPGRAAAAKK